MAAPTVRGYTFGSSNQGTTCDVSAPTPMNVGNTLVMLIGASNNPTITMPSGWNRVASNTGTVRLETWTKAVVSADIGRSIRITMSGQQAIVGVCFVINNNDWSWDGSGYSPSDPVRTAATNTSSTPNPPNVPYGFSGRANVVLCDYVAGNGGSATPPGHTGFPGNTPDSNYQASTYNSAPDGVRHGWASIERSGGSSWDPDAFGISRSALWRAATMVFRDQRAPTPDFTVSEVPGFPLQRTFTVVRNVGDPDVDSWNWDFGTGDGGGGTTQTYAFPGPGTYTVVLTANNSDSAKNAAQDVVIPATGAGVGLDGQADGGGINVATLGLVGQMAGRSDGFATNSADISRKRLLAGTSNSVGDVYDAALTGGSTGAPALINESWQYYLDLDTGDVYSQDNDGYYWKQGTLPGTGGGGGGGAPTTADYLTGTAQAGLSAEIVVGTTPQGELGGTWAAPTIDASHSGSTHAATQAAAEATASGALGTHAAAADPHTGYRLESQDHSHATTGLQGGTVAHSALTGLTAGNDHTQYQQTSQKAAASGYASLDASTLVPVAQMGTGAPTGSKFLRDDRTWQVPAGGGGGAPVGVDYLVGTADATLTGEIVVGTTPGGELGGTWASPTVDAAHSGSTHAAAQAAAEATAAAALAAAVPPGAVQMFAGAAAPTGWLLCDGASLLRAGTYANLFAAIGVVYGSVDGTHFNVPDLRQRFPIGKGVSGTGSTLGGTGGAIDHAHSNGVHTHPITAQVTGQQSTGDDTITTSAGSNNSSKRIHTHSLTGNVDVGTASNTGATNPPFIVLNFIIRY